MLALTNLFVNAADAGFSGEIPTGAAAQRSFSRP
jgi:hypothetical protein